MQAVPYSFIDVAALDGVRERFAAGDAVVILSSDLDEMIWANGPGALLFGHNDIEAVGGANSGLSHAARRQIMATTGYPHIGQDRGVVVRLAKGMESRAFAFLASEIRLPDGEDAIMLVEPAGHGAGDKEIALRAIGGFTDPGHLAAFVDGEGRVEAASPGFASLGITSTTLASLATEAGRTRGRLVKKIIPAGTSSVPAGMVRLRDLPPRNLLIVVDERQMIGAIESASPTPETEPAADAVAAPIDASQAVVQPIPEPTAESALDEIALPRFTLEDLPTLASRPVPKGLIALAPEDSALLDEGAGARQETSDDDIPAAADDGVVYPQTEDASIEPRQATSGALDVAIEAPVDRAATPLRFVWQTDAEGRFSAVSPEFLRAVGADPINVLGKRFRTLSEELGLDPFNDIAGLLERRDTWSGRSVFWPVAGTDLRVPVDLAALPAYGRDRSFEGFRGFGVARMGDAVVDPDARGLTLATAEPRLPLEGSLAPADDPFRGEVPALAITPRPADRRDADKVIKLAEHRPKELDKSLSAGERTAFREIGERLREGHAPTLAPQTPNTSLPPVVADTTANTEAKRTAIPETPVVGSTRSQPAVPEAGASAEVPAPTPAPAQALGSDRTRPLEPPAVRPSSADLKIDGFLPSAFSGPTAEVRRPFQDTPILARLPVPVLIHSGDILHYANEEFLTLTGYGSVKALADAGGLDALFFEPYSEPGSQDGADQALRMKARDGSEFAIDALLRAVPWNGGRALMLVVRRTDLGEENEAEEAPLASVHAPPPLQPADVSSISPAEHDALKARVAEMRTIIDTATDGVILITNEGTIRSISRPAEALFGFDNDDVAGKPFASLFAIESQRAARDYLTGLLDNGVASVLNDGREVIGREAQGRFIPLFMTIGRLPGDGGFCAVVRDITQWKRAEEELTQARALAERASSQKTDFLARVSHEIRTPLNAIIGFSELMVDERFGPIANDRYRDYLRDINRSGNHVLDLVNDLLDISKIEAGEQEMEYEAVSLNDALAETVAMMQPQANRERVIIRSSLASRLPEVVADRRSVRQIALNILSNAVRYTQAGGQVIVSTAYELTGDVVMRVRDTGIGMSAAEIEQALKPFKQINAVKRGRGDGTGLGLPLTKAMVEANRARFAITSTPGEGTLVEIVFPAPRVLAD